MTVQLALMIFTAILSTTSPFGLLKDGLQVSAPPCAWNSPINLSETPDQESRHGAIVGDPYGQVHAFWTETYGEPSQSRDYIAYRYNADGRWSPTYDILLSPANGWASVRNGAALADSEHLYLAWHDNQGVNVSVAPVELALDARTWATTRLYSGPAVAPAIAQGKEGTLHVLYVGSQYSALFYTFSTDAGITWSEPVEVWSVASSDRMIAQPSLAEGANGVLHATWQVNVRALDWTPTGIRYTRSLDGGLTWATPIEFEDALGGDPLVFEDPSNGKVWLMWNGRAGTPGGRYYAWSDDEGYSWSKMGRRDQYWGGLNGRPSAFVDNMGRVVVMFTAVMQLDRIHTRPMAAFLNGTELGQPALLSDESGYIIWGDSPAFAITGGNHLHALLWTQEEKAGEILYADCVMAAPPAELKTYPMPTVKDPTPAPITQPTLPRQDAVTPELSEAMTVIVPLDPAPVRQQNVLMPILVSSITSLVVIMVVGGSYLRRWRG